MKKIKYITILFIALVLSSCHSQKKDEHEHEHKHEKHEKKGIVFLSEQQQEALDLKLGGFQMRNLTSIVKINGELAVPPEKTATVTAIIGGNVKQIKVFYGDYVRKGQTLAILEHPDYISVQEDFAGIANRLEFLKHAYERQKELYDNQVGAGKDFERAKAEYYTAKAQYSGLKLRLQQLNLSPEKVKNGLISNQIKIVSPISGYVNKININTGGYAGASTPLFEITDNTAVHADFMVYEKDIHLIKKGQKIHIRLANHPDKEFTGKIFAIGKKFDDSVRAIQVHAKIEEEKKNLIPGMYLTGHLHTDEKYTRTLPDDAIVKQGEKSYIFILDEDSSAETLHSEHPDETGKNEHPSDEHSDEDEHNHADEHGTAFRMIEVITGTSDSGYTEIKLLSDMPENPKIVLNGAYYLLADMKKEETEHKH